MSRPGLIYSARALATDLGHWSESPLRNFGRARRLTGIEVPFERVRG